ncbi:MAG TPA: hypothetical protein VGR26_15185 [Acidimicrobiales bacterium]|nr:hypothetical protein [Acidimicrobiales bacterium]
MTHIRRRGRGRWRARYRTLDYRDSSSSVLDWDARSSPGSTK